MHTVVTLHGGPFDGREASFKDGYEEMPIVIPYHKPNLYHSAVYRCEGGRYTYVRDIQPGENAFADPEFRSRGCTHV